MSGDRCQATGARRQVPDDRCQATGARRQVPDDRCQFNSILIRFGSIAIQFNSVQFNSVQFPSTPARGGVQCKVLVQQLPPQAREVGEGGGGRLLMTLEIRDGAMLELIFITSKRCSEIETMKISSSIVPNTKCNTLSPPSSHFHS